MSSHRSAGCFAVLVIACLSGLAGSLPIEPGSGVYIVAFRTGKHVNTSEPAVFHEAVDGVLELLRKNDILIREDPVRPMIRTADPISLPSLLNVTRDVSASSLLFVTIDRPVTKWLKIKLDCYDQTGRLLWTEEAAEGGGFSGKNAVPNTLSKLAKRLEVRWGKEGLPRSETSAATKPELLPEGKP